MVDRGLRGLTDDEFFRRCLRRYDIRRGVKVRFFAIPYVALGPLPAVVTSIDRCIYPRVSIATYRRSCCLAVKPAFIAVSHGGAKLGCALMAPPKPGSHGPPAFFVNGAGGFFCSSTIRDMCRFAV